MQPWSRAYRNANKHPNRFLFSMGKTDKRLEYFKWEGDFYTVKDVIYNKTSKAGINISTPSVVEMGGVESSA
jgi:polar amino acid transport system substrate-binding protein